MISRREAIKRLRHRWLAQTAVQPDVATVFPLEHFLTEGNIDVVRRLDLYSYYSKPRHDDHQRNRELLQAWLNARDRGVRQ